MTSTALKTIALIVTATAAGWAVLEYGQPPLRQETELIFSHRRHLEAMGVECEQCHPGVAESHSGRDDLLPLMALCGECHDIEDPENCKTCHSRLEAPESKQPVIDYSPKFDHANHVHEHEIDCERCHAGVSASDSASSWHIPGMALCMSCHDGVQAGSRCLTCHQHERGKIPADHVLPFWRRQHGDAARMDNAQSCLMCHARDNCEECHQGDNVLPRAHPLGWTRRHGIEVRKDWMDCAACHQDRSFCVECHQERFVFPLSHQLRGWIAGGGGRHATQARLNIESCTACHPGDPESSPVCVRCHGS